ncbi:MAG: hypothetical protein JEY99_00445 [Spirochaetales bacterium]|nr:hypothetical protein [Spirochaetales bacterium]
MKLTRNIFILFFAVLVFTPVIAQETIEDLPPGIEQNKDPGIGRMKGDQIFSFNAGLLLPLFTSDTDWNFESGFEHLSLGGVGSLEWSGHLNSNLFVGGQLSGMFAVTPNQRTFTMVPICARVGYIFNLHPITIPITLAAGFSFNNLDDLFEFTPIIKPGASFYWNINYEWSVGFNLNYWWVPEFHTGDLAGQTRFGNFLETSFSAAYYF